MSERFAVGDAVTYHDGLVGTPLKCHIIRVMPSDNRAGLYHIRDLAENFDRAVSGNTLTRVLPGNDDTHLYLKETST
jgi:hypothetical protein